MAEVADFNVAALLASPVRRSLLEALEQHERDAADGPGLTAADLAPVVDLHVTTVRFHLDQLVAAGVLGTTFQRQEGAGRPRKVYALAHRPAAGPPSSSRSGADDNHPLRLLTTLLVEAMSSSAKGETVTPVEAGRRWAREHIAPLEGPVSAETPGAWLGKVGRLIDVLEEWGYRPELSTGDGGRTATVELSDCPFLDLARSNVAVVCGVHQGLVSEAMRQFGEPDTEVRLEPFVAPSRCLAHLRRSSSFGGASPEPSGEPRPETEPPE